MDLYRDGDTPEVASFRSMYDAQALKYETMATAETLIAGENASEPEPAEDDEASDEVWTTTENAQVITTESADTTSAGGGGSISWSLLLLVSLLLAGGRYPSLRNPTGD
jgi:hypothetical protein